MHGIDNKTQTFNLSLVLADSLVRPNQRTNIIITGIYGTIWVLNLVKHFKKSSKLDENSLSLKQFRSSVDLQYKDFYIFQEIFIIKQTESQSC